MNFSTCGIIPYVYIQGNFQDTKFLRMGSFRKYIFKDGHLGIIDSNGTKYFS